MRGGRPPDPQGRKGLAELVKFRQGPQVGVQEQAAVDHHEGLPVDEIGQRRQASRGAPWNRLSRIMQPHPETATVPHDLFIGIRGGIDGQGDFVDAARLQEIQHVFHHRTVGHRQQGLGHRPDQGHQVGVSTPGENHRLHGCPP